ncbi:S1C family serine protease [Haloparvum sp. AD34]
MDKTRRGFLGAVGAAATATAGCVAPSSSRGTGENRYEQVYEQVSPSVVRIRTYADGPRGQGSGFFYDGDHVLTNAHVVSGADDIRIQYADGTWEEVEVVGTDPYSDLAVIEAGRDAVSAPLPLVEELPDIGTEVLVVGSPLGLEGSASQGIISGRNRSIPGPNNFSIADAIQTDAALNPGNSGGPIVTLDGEVVAVATANIPGTDNLGFGVSAPLIERVAPALVEDGSYEHSYMGVGILEVDPLLAAANDLAEARGVYIASVVDGGPSDGVLQGSDGTTTVDGTSVPTGGDVVVGFEDTEIRTQGELSRYLALETSPGDVIDVAVVRDGERQTVELELGSRPEPT